jgi:stage II sporulation protein D
MPLHQDVVEAAAGHGWKHRFASPVPLVLLLLPLMVAGGCVSTQPAGSGPTSRHADTTALRQMRVLVQESRSASLTVQGPCRVVDSRGNSLFTTLVPATFQVVPDSQQPAVVLLNNRTVPSGSRILPRTSGSIQIDGKPYGGTLTLLNRSGRLLLVNNLDVEEYLPGVLTGELFPKFHIEAYQAQAVAARTYALYQKFANPKQDYDVTSTTSSQVYVGSGSEKAVQAVRATCGRLLTWSSPTGEKMFCPYYSSTCGGQTSPVNYLQPVAPIPPLAGGVVCTSCTHAKYYTWEPVHISRAELTQKLRAKFPVFQTMGPIQRIEPVEVMSGGRIVWLQLLDARGQCVRMRASQFRLTVGPGLLRSTWCRIDAGGDGFTFSGGRGFGHGVGMCQFGADGLGQAGWNYRAILAHYYPGSHITKAY